MSDQFDDAFQRVFPPDRAPIYPRPAALTAVAPIPDDANQSGAGRRRAHPAGHGRGGAGHFRFPRPTPLAWVLLGCFTFWVFVAWLVYPR